MTGISENKVNQDELARGFAFHERLNPQLWDGDTMLPEVRVALLRAAKAFYEFLEIPGLRVEDIVFTGSNAAYNYTEFSDLDVHLIVDFSESTCPGLADNLFTTKKNLWNRVHDITVRGQDVEMYVEDTANPVTAQGVYSLLRGEWVHKPKPEKPSWDDHAIAAKVELFADRIEDLLDNDPTKAEIDRLADRLKRMRRSGLAKGGEFSVENLAYKGLRNLGFLDRLWSARLEIQDRELSLETSEQ